MSPQDWFGIIAVTLATIGYGSYVTTVLKRQTKPHLFSWAIWSVVMAIVFAAQLVKGAGAGAWVTGFSAAACLVIALLAITRGEKNVTRSDRIALAMAFSIIPVWYFTQDALWAVIFSCAIDALAYYPTFRKSWHKPYEENFLTYSMDTVKWIVSFFALENYSAATVMYPVFLILTNSSLIAMIMWRRRPVSPLPACGRRTKR